MAKVPNSKNVYGENTTKIIKAKSVYGGGEIYKEEFPIEKEIYGEYRRQKLDKC